MEGGDECQEGMDEVPVEQAGQKVEKDRQEEKNQREVSENGAQRTFSGLLHNGDR